MKSKSQLSYTERIHSWILCCENGHEMCRANRACQASNPARPARLLDVQSQVPGVDVLLVHFAEADGSYAALSYSWAERPHSASTAYANLKARADSILLNKLPKTFTDAFAFCRDMGTRYLRIGALCIIQPRLADDEDWQAQTRIMGYIHANAVFNVTAPGAASADIGLFPSKVPFDLNPRSCPLSASESESSIHVKAEPARLGGISRRKRFTTKKLGVAGEIAIDQTDPLHPARYLLGMCRTACFRIRA